MSIQINVLNMSQKDLKQKAIQLRMQGMSYSQIKESIKISKGTLSMWLREYPLPEERIKALRGNNPKRIERFRNTMAAKKEERLRISYNRVAQDLGVLSNREMLIAGFFLYWGEGSKTAAATTALTNTNPTMLIFFIRWLKLLGVKKSDMRVKLHLYSDMDIEKTKIWWSKKLGIPPGQFRKSYIKETSQSSAVYKGYFRYGTCTVIYDNVILLNYILMGLKYLGAEVEGRKNTKD